MAHRDDQDFDRVVEFVARWCDTPMGVIGLTGDDGLWLAATVGISDDVAEQVTAFCRRAIRHDGRFVVLDVLADPRLRDDPIVATEPVIRSCHAVPLTASSGVVLGTLAVLDHRPRELEPLQRDALDVLADQVTAQLEQRRLREALAEVSDHYAELFAANPLPMFIFDVETLAFLSVNHAAVAQYGYSREQLLSMTIADIRPAEDVERLHQHLAVESPGLDRAGIWRHRRADGTVFSVEITSHTLTFAGRPAELVVARDVTDVEVAERQAAELAQRLGRTFDTITDGVVVLDREWRFTFVNPTGAELLRRPRDEMIGRVLWEAFPEAVGTRLDDAFRRAMDTGEVAEFDIWWEPMDRWGEARAFPSDDGLTVYFRDVTDERAAATAAARHTERLTTIVRVWRSLSDSITSLDELYDAIPDVAAEVLGVDAALLGFVEGDELVLHADRNLELPAPRAPLAGTLSGAAIALGETLRTDDVATDPRLSDLVRVPSGTVSGMTAPLFGMEGAVGIIAVSSPVAGAFDERDQRSFDLLAQALSALIRRLADEAALRQSEERFRLLSRATVDAIYDWDLVEQRVWWSDGMRVLFGWEPAEVRTESWRELVHPDDLERVLAASRAHVADPEQDTLEVAYRFCRSDGTYARVHDRSYVSRNDQGRAVRLIGAISDITAELEAEARAAQSQRLEAVGQLTGGVAHDFNNLLTVILGAADQLLRSCDDRPDLAPFVEMSRTAALRGAELTHRLLAFARRQPLEPQPTDVNRLLATMDDLLRRTLPESIELEYVRGAGLWAALVDPAQLEGAILNLCINARDAMPAGGRLTIETANARIDHDYADAHDDVVPGQYVMVAVTDSGSGIEPEVLARVFEPFFTTKRAGSGSGLGLSMVHGFVKQSAGHVKIYSERGEGTTVRMYLPRSHEGATAHPAIDVAHAEPHGTERILLVEDDQLVQALAARHLRSLGYEVVVAGNGVDALDVLRARDDIDLLFTDVVMPGMGGRELADAARELRPGLPVLFTSGYTENAIVHHGRLDVGVELLSKPYRLAELARRVRDVLDRRPSDGLNG